MNIEIEMINRISSIKWFSNCGKELNVQTDFDIKYVNSWTEAEKYYFQSSWEEKTLEERNNLTAYLFNKYGNVYSKWNSIVKEAKKFIDDEVEPKIQIIKEENNLNAIFIDYIKWDLLGAIMENEYLKCNGIPIFSLKLLEVYESGNFPCGWEKKTSKENLIVF